jgi:lysophospholipase L1-like esterase
MKKKFKIVVTVFSIILLGSCSVENQLTDVTSKPPLSDNINTTPEPLVAIPTKDHTVNYLALGDSYTIGQSVCEICRFPAQLVLRLKNANTANSYNLKIIAQTGWTTTNLLSGITSQNLPNTYDFVSLLIGVNNQYQRINFSVYEKEFPELVAKSIALAGGDKSKVIVVSIPDYAYTPFGQNSGKAAGISAEIDFYNAYVKKYCSDNEIKYVSITDITRNGLANPTLVAGDGLHPSEIAYSLFVDRIAPQAAIILQN